MRSSHRSPLAYALAISVATFGCSGDDPVDPVRLVTVEEVTFAPDLDVDLSSMTRLESGVYIEDLEPGEPEAREVRPLFYLWVTYDGWLSDGTQFAARETLEELQIGAGNVISGWDLGLIGMRQGGTRRLVIPPERGFGLRGSGTVIPPNSVLVFDVQVDSISAASDPL